MDGQRNASLASLWPRLGEASPEGQTGGGQYFYQDIWALNKVARNGHAYHVDVGSRIDGFVGQATAIKPVVFVDIRPRPLALDRFSVVAGSILRLPFRTESIPSLSCLHVIEHIGLGRYGDPLDPLGPERAAAELKRVLAPGGELYIGVPVGRPTVQFNAQRILAPDTALGLFGDLELVEFSGIDDAGTFALEVAPASLAACDYGCGLLHFRRA